MGLVPIPGKVITEMDALSILGFPKMWLIGRGGISGAEGGSTFIVEDDRDENITALLRLIRDMKDTALSGVESSLKECITCGPNRRWHLGCVYGRNARFKEEIQ